MSNYPKHDKALAYARHCLGVHETYRNRGPIQVSNPPGGVDLFQEKDFAAGVGYSWCASFWVACWAMSGHPFPYPSASAYAIGDWARQHGWTKSVTTLIPGDGCVWNEGAGHMSLFERYDPNTGLVHTIDGNWGDRVARATHPVRYLRVGIHVPEKKVTTLPKKPYFVIATSVNGHKKILFSQYAYQRKVIGVLPRLLKRWGVNGITIKRSKKKPT